MSGTTEGLEMSAKVSMVKQAAEAGSQVPQIFIYTTKYSKRPEDSTWSSPPEGLNLSSGFANILTTDALLNLTLRNLQEQFECRSTHIVFCVLSQHYKPLLPQSEGCTAL